MDNNKPELKYSVIKSASVVESVKDWIIDQLISGSLRPGQQAAHGGGTLRQHGRQPQLRPGGNQAA